MCKISCDRSLCPVNQSLQCAARSINVKAIEVMGTEQSDNQRTDNIANDLDLHLPVCDQFITIQEEKDPRLAGEQTVIHCEVGECAYNEDGVVSENRFIW